MTPMWGFIPISNIVIPLLHITLGLANNILNRFLDWLDETIEPLTLEEKEARTMTMLAEIAVKDATESLQNKVDGLHDIIDQRKRIN